MKHQEKENPQKQTEGQWGWGWEQEVIINRHEGSYWGGENVLKHFMVTVTQLCTFTKNH